MDPPAWHVFKHSQESSSNLAACDSDEHLGKVSDGLGLRAASGQAPKSTACAHAVTSQVETLEKVGDCA